MKQLLIILVILAFNKLNCQVTNSIAPNRTGMYFNSVDTLIATLDDSSTINKIHIISNQYITKFFPDSLRGISIQKHQLNTRLISNEKLKSGEALIKISDIEFSKDRFYINMVFIGKIPSDEMRLIKMTYIYNAKQEIYELNNIKKSIFRN